MSEPIVNNKLSELGLEETTQLLLDSARRAVELVQQESRQAREMAGRAAREHEAMQDEVEIVRAQLDAARNDASRSDAEAQVQKRTARRAYLAAASVGLIALFGAVFSSSNLVRSSTERAHLAEQLAQVRETATQRDAKVTQLLGELERVRLAEARALGELRAYQASRVASLPADGTFRLTPTSDTRSTLTPTRLAPATRPSVVNMLMELMPGPLGEPNEE